MTNDRKPLPEDDFVGNAAPFALKITLEYPPRETESLLGFMPKEGKNFYDFEKFPDKRFYGNIERAFGTLILNMLGGAVNDYANGVLTRIEETMPKKTSLNVYHLSATENTRRKMPKFNPYQTGHGVIGDTKYNRRKTKRELRKLIDES